MVASPECSRVPSPQYFEQLSNQIQKELSVLYGQYHGFSDPWVQTRHVVGGPCLAAHNSAEFPEFSELC